MPELVAYCYWVVRGAASVTEKTTKHNLFSVLLTSRIINFTRPGVDKVKPKARQGKARQGLYLPLLYFVIPALNLFILDPDFLNIVLDDVLLEHCELHHVLPPPGQVRVI